MFCCFVFVCFGWGVVGSFSFLILNSWCAMHMYFHVHVYTCKQISYRWLKSWKVSMASEKQQRALSTEIAGGTVGESVLFSFATRNRGQVMRQAPYVWVESLREKIIDTLIHNDR